MSAPHDVLVAGAPRWRRPGLRVLYAMALRPRGAKLIVRLPQLEQALGGLLALVRYDDPTLARSLGWDANAVAARGRALRRGRSER